jgi:hypothetical protein
VPGLPKGASAPTLATIALSDDHHRGTRSAVDLPCDHPTAPTCGGTPLLRAASTSRWAGPLAGVRRPGPPVALLLSTVRQELSSSRRRSSYLSLNSS